MLLIVGVVDDQVAALIVIEAAIARAAPAGRSPGPLDDHRRAIAVHQSLAVAPQIRAEYRLRPAAGDVIIGCRLLAAIIVAGEQVIIVAVAEEEAALPRI